LGRDLLERDVELGIAGRDLQQGLAVEREQPAVGQRPDGRGGRLLVQHAGGAHDVAIAEHHERRRAAWRDLDAQLTEAVLDDVKPLARLPDRRQQVALARADRDHAPGELAQDRVGEREEE
jgi:hypothetical protein